MLSCSLSCKKLGAQPINDGPLTSSRDKPSRYLLHHCQVAIDNWSLLEKELWTPTNIPYLFLTPKATKVKRGWNFPFFSYFRIRECREQMLLIFPVLSQLVAHKSWVLDSHWIPPLQDLQSGTQQAPKKMTGVDRCAAEIRSADGVYLSIQALCVFNTQAFKSHIHHVQSKTEHLLLCAPIQCTGNLYPHPSHSVK